VCCARIRTNMSNKTYGIASRQLSFNQVGVLAVMGMEGGLGVEDEEGAASEGRGESVGGRDWRTVPQ